jgi:hypothetical protein
MNTNLLLSKQTSLIPQTLYSVTNNDSESITVTARGILINDISNNTSLTIDKRGISSSINSNINLLNDVDMNNKNIVNTNNITCHQLNYTT